MDARDNYQNGGFTEMSKVAWLGTGVMGASMARHLKEKGLSSEEFGLWRRRERMGIGGLRRRSGVGDLEGRSGKL